MSELSANEAISITVEARAHGWRIDHYLARLYPNYSRSAFQKAINQGAVLLNGLPAKTGRRLRVNDSLSVKLPEESDSSLPAEDIPLEILYEDDSLVVLNKAANMIVHPGRGNYHGTMAGALQFHFDQLSDMAGQLRPGIVHRLDRDTTGVIIVAKDNQIHSRLSSQFEKREVTKEYRALIWGNPDFDSDTIETHMSVHPGKREKMQVCEPGGNSREATTRYEVIQRFEKATYIRLLPKTGRTHQLRVHMSHLGHPILADSLYRGRSQVTQADLNPQCDAAAENAILIQRQALHAMRLTFRHPQSGNEMTIEAPLPDDMQATLNYLESLDR
ncbi:MAG: RluA family pseudouridine synthase [Planctomycetaceae bacterium]|jgi:23S rRNA pseudouridine1911/1915/1917 synthase|nr:RluA family pseudouridine synthase [Planctomycetaceae bacterium]MDA0806628.1 RluA family pseudouridine synthase [Planctomycetota bacterium]MDA0920164.1 RluA family pseudouridine synthase [Planctomycetota bacterium]